MRVDCTLHAQAPSTRREEEEVAEDPPGEQGHGRIGQLQGPRQGQIQGQGPQLRWQGQGQEQRQGSGSSDSEVGQEIAAPSDSVGSATSKSGAAVVSSSPQLKFKIDHDHSQSVNAISRWADGIGDDLLATDSDYDADACGWLDGVEVQNTRRSNACSSGGMTRCSEVGGGVIVGTSFGGMAWCSEVGGGGLNTGSASDHNDDEVIYSSGMASLENIVESVDKSDSLSLCFVKVVQSVLIMFRGSARSPAIRWRWAYCALLLRRLGDKPFDEYGKSSIRVRRQARALFAKLGGVLSVGIEVSNPDAAHGGLQAEQHAPTTPRHTRGACDEVLVDGHVGVGEASVEPESIPMFKPRRIPRGGRKNKR